MLFSGNAEFEWRFGGFPVSLLCLSGPSAECDGGAGEWGGDAFMLMGFVMVSVQRAPTGQWPMALTAGVSPARVRQWLDGWIWDTKSEDKVTFQEFSGTMECTAWDVSLTNRGNMRLEVNYIPSLYVSQPMNIEQKCMQGKKLGDIM